MHAVQTSGVTFAVDNVVPSTKPLREQRTHEALRTQLGRIESCCDYHGTLVKGIDYQPLLAAVFTAFSEHRPLVLTPDAVWLTIAQGVAHHMAVEGERLRSRFVSHSGRLDLLFDAHDWIAGSPENPWADAFASWAGQIRDHVGPAVHDLLVCDFSTSGPLEQTASRVVMMDVFERYFHYELLCICGIPTVTLEGTTADWERLSEKAAGLRIFDLDWWLPHLLPICEQFVRASRGEFDRNHWQAICKLRSAYGGNIINGWVAKLFPYLREFPYGPCTRRNPIFDTGKGFQSFVAPPGLSRVPFTWRDATQLGSRRMEAIGGLLGVTQDAKSLALRPKIGWAVRELNKLDVLLERVAAEHETRPGRRSAKLSELPPDLASFYHATDGAELKVRKGTTSCRIVPHEEITPLDWGEVDKDVGSVGPAGRIWHRFAELADGSWLAVNLDINLGSLVWRDAELKRQKQQRDRDFAPICHGSEATRNQPGENLVVALSFTELLEQILNNGSEPYWLTAGFVGFGDAERFTRRGD